MSSIARLTASSEVYLVATPEPALDEILRLRLRMTEEGLIQIFVFA